MERAPLGTLRQASAAAPTRAAAYRVHCVGEQGQAFCFVGIFRTEWDAIDHAIGLGALAARPRRLPGADR